METVIGLFVACAFVGVVALVAKTFINAFAHNHSYGNGYAKTPAITAKQVLEAAAKVTVDGRFNAERFNEVCDHDAGFARRVLIEVMKGIDIYDVDAFRQIATDLKSGFPQEVLKEIVDNLGTTQRETDLRIQLAWAGEELARRVTHEDNIVRLFPSIDRDVVREHLTPMFSSLPFA